MTSDATKPGKPMKPGEFQGHVNINPPPNASGRTFEFRIVEKSSAGIIGWDAIELATKTQFPANASGPYMAVEYREITDYLKSQGIPFDVKYQLGSDSINPPTWTFVRGSTTVLVHEIARTMFRLARFPCPSGLHTVYIASRVSRLASRDAARVDSAR
jgi:hypothetical protein